ncbi:Ragulator complex protein LAMTOR1 [Bagarius yarrelli]|uniref:Ragulator complex protein LAMTOR1 n=1 Tax=Bagarius yarrelli TaxID=175774 RepID=A0A556TTT4_BAGYA|nr:Ragulator complex protein LAMTOR1 [Bagarius yarrelli]
MGCCYSSESETPEQDGDERKPLIPHPNPDSKPLNGTERNPANISSTRTDEQALLWIINKTAHTLSQKKPPSLPSLTSQPHQVLASDLVPYSDIQQVCKVAAYTYSAISQIKVDAKEELVVQFAIP